MPTYRFTFRDTDGTVLYQCAREDVSRAAARKAAERDFANATRHDPNEAEVVAAIHRMIEAHDAGRSIVEIDLAGQIVVPPTLEYVPR